MVPAVTFEQIRRCRHGVSVPADKEMRGMSNELKTARRARALSQALSSDFLLREQFVTDPAGILSEYVDGKPMPLDDAAAANQLLYALVSKPEMLNWMRQYADDLQGKTPTDREFAK